MPRKRLPVDINRLLFHTKYMDSIDSKHLAIAFVLMILAGISGFFLGRYSLSGILPLKTAENAQAPTVNPIFTTQTATFDGVITNIFEGHITAKNKDNQDQTFVLAPNVTVYKITPGKQATASVGLDAVELNKKASLRIDFLGKAYLVTSITYLVQ
jgi:hypothetical protein